MNPAARLAELRSARKGIPRFTPPDSPNSPDCLGEGRRDSWDNRDNRVGGNPEPTPDNRDNRDNRVNETPGAGPVLGIHPPDSPNSPDCLAPDAQPRQLGQLGQSGGVKGETDPSGGQRWGTPPGTIRPATYLRPNLPTTDAALLASHLQRQPPAVWQWVEAQVTRYTTGAPNWPRQACEQAAMLDALLWQWAAVLPKDADRYDRTKGAVRKLRGLDEASRHFEAHPLPEPQNGGPQA